MSTAGQDRGKGFAIRSWAKVRDRRPCEESSAPEAQGSPSRKGSSGMRAYNLVVLAMAVTLLNVWIASTLPLWSHQIQRDKEAELIFRGLQYAEAIRVFQQRYNRYPTNLKELIEVEPRCIRQLWENPMRDDGRWGLIPVGVGGQVGRGNPGQPGGEGGPGGRGQGRRNGGRGAGERGGFGEGGGDGLGSDPFAPDGEDENAGVLLSADPDDSFGAPPGNVPIRGVFSPTSKETTRIFLGKESIRDWQFTVELVSAQKPGLADNPNLITPFLAHEIGRPWPAGVTPQVTQPSSEAQQQQQQGQNVGGGVPVNDQGDPVIGGPRPQTPPTGGGQGGRPSTDGRN